MIFFIIIGVSIAIFLILILIKLLTVGGSRKLKQGLRLEAAGKYYEALSVYDYLLQNGYSPAELRWKIANISLKVNNVARAQKELMILIQASKLPANVSLFAVKTLLIECYQRLGQVKDAFFSLIELSKIDPNNNTLIFELAKIYAGQKLTGKAIKLFEKCLEQNPNDAEMNYYLARAYLDYGDPSNALKYLEKTTRLRYFDNGKVNYYLGILYFANKNYNQALQQFVMVLKQRSNDNKYLADSHHYIALCYKEKGLIDEAITNFEKSQIYSELLPGDIKSKQLLYNQGILLYKQGHYSKALDKFYKVKMLDYKYKDIDRIIRTITSKIKNGDKMGDDVAPFINENPLVNIMRRGLLYSKVKFNIESLEQKAEKYATIVNGAAIGSTVDTQSQNSYNTISKFNAMSSKNFKDLSRKLIKALGFDIRSEPKFFGDNEYIDGNAINFTALPIKNYKSKEYLITIRRYKEPVEELSVSRFIDWLEEKQYKQGIFIASQPFSTHALKLIQMYPNIRFIDKSGLARILGRIR